LLKNIDPLLSPELLRILAEMGHEDAVVLADANFTAMRYRASTTSQTVVRLPGISLARAARAVLSVLPLGIAQEDPVAYMQVSGYPAGQASAAQQEVIDLMYLADAAHTPIKPLAVERFAFYELAQKAYVIVQTGELQPFANFIFKKGVLSGG
jgi:L-fucose mutarotase